MSARTVHTQPSEFGWPQGDRPGALDFAYEPPAAVQDAIRGALANAFPAVRDACGRLASLVPVQDPAGRYRLRTGDGRAWFVRVSARWGAPELERDVAEFLVSEGVSVRATIVSGVPLRWGSHTYRIDVHPLVVGRHFDGSMSDLHGVAAALAECHQALRRYPRSAEIRNRASVRHDCLTDACRRLDACLRTGAFDGLHEQAAWAAEHRDWLAHMQAEFDAHVERWPGAQCLHGEVHQGNVVFRSNDGAPVLVDLEEAISVFAPPSWDLAYLVQRFCLHDAPSRAVLDDRLAAVRRGYGSALPDLGAMMRYATWFSVAVIVDLRLRHGVVTPLRECDKFLALARQAAEYDGLL